MDSKNDTRQGGERVAKVMARAGLCSRREAEEWIAAGRVTVNGKAIISPALDITPDDRVEVDGAPLPQRERTRLFRYHKPRGLVTSNADPQGRSTIFEHLPKDLPRLISIGRLDLGSEGLLLLTNDGGLARVLELPDTAWVRRYRVRAHGHITQEKLDTLRDGITVEGIHYGPIEAKLDIAPGANVWLTVDIREGKNREVRNVMAAVGLDVNRLLRVGFGPFELADLPEGALDEVPTKLLRQALGEAIVRESSADFDAPLIAPATGRVLLPPRKFREERADRGEHSERGQLGERREPGGRGERRDRDTRGSFAGRGERRSAGTRDVGTRDVGDRPDSRSRGPRRDNREGDASEAETAPRKRIGKYHGDTRVWRDGDAPLRRKFHGARAQREDDKPAGPKREGVVEDRKGRQVLVERFGDPKPEVVEKPRRGRDAKPAGQRSHGDRPRGDRPFGKPRFGDAKPAGDRPSRFDKPRGERSASERPRGERPQGDRPRGDRPFGKPRFGDAKPAGDRPSRYDKPRGERSGRERPRAERPQGDRPRGDRPFGKPGGRPSGRKPPRRDRSSGPRPSRPKD